MPIRNPFRKTVGGVEVNDENRPLSRGGADRGFQNTPVAGSKAVDIKEPTEYKLSGKASFFTIVLRMRPALRMSAAVGTCELALTCDRNQ